MVKIIQGLGGLLKSAVPLSQEAIKNQGIKKVASKLAFYAIVAFLIWLWANGKIQLNELKEVIEVIE